MLAPDGQLLAVKLGTVDVRVHYYKTKIEPANLPFQTYEIAKSGANAMAWSADSQVLSLAGNGWVGTWLPLADPPEFYAMALPAAVKIEQMAILRAPLQVIFAKGRSIDSLLLAQKPLLTNWQSFMAQIPEPDPGTEFKAKRDWTWARTQWGYDGVHTYEGKLLWYSHSYGPHGGGGAMEQSFSSFLENGPSTNGPAEPIPETILAQVCQAVRYLSA